MKNKIHTILLLIFTVCSCTTSQNGNENEIELQGTRVKVDSAYYGSYPILICDSLLFSSSNSTTEKCVISSLTNGYLKGSQKVFRVGNGNDEFHNIAITKGENSSLYILDYPMYCNQLLSITHITKTNSIDSIKDSKMWEKFSLIDLPSFRCVSQAFVSISDSTFLVPGAPYDAIGHIMSVVDFKNHTLTPLEYWPSDGVQGDSLAKHSIYTNNCRIFSNQKDRFLYRCGEERFAFIFTIEGKNIKILKELYSVLPDYKCKGDGNYKMNSRSGNGLAIDVTPNNIYVFLYKEKLENNAFHRSGNTIEVYDWNGTLEKTLILDKSGDFMKVSDDNNTLYLFSNNQESGEEEIWMYNLNNDK